MSNLDNLTSKIIRDAEVKKEEILNEANSKAEIIIKNKIEEASKNASSILEKAEIESKIIKERVLSKAELDIRNKKLQAKQELIEKVFEEAKKQLENMSAEEFQKFIRDSIMSLNIDGDEEIILNTNDRGRLPVTFLEDINSELQSKGKLGNLRFGERDYEIKGGFILSKNGIEINNSFEELVNSLKYDLEYEVGRLLFQD